MTSELPVTIPGKSWSLEARKQMMRDVVSWFDKLGILSLVQGSGDRGDIRCPGDLRNRRDDASFIGGRGEMSCAKDCTAISVFGFNGNILVAVIQSAVAESFGINPVEMVSARRGQPNAFYRQIAMYLSRELTPYSLPAIGRLFGNRDHTTIMHGIRVVERIIAENPEISSKIDAIRQQVIHSHIKSQELVTEFPEAA